MTARPSISAWRTQSWRSLAAAASLGLFVAGCGTAVPVGGDMGPVGSITPAKSQFTAIYPHNFPIHGIDVSKYQGDIDWESVRQGGITFAYIKATEGSDRVDQKFRQNWDAAKAAGLKRGAYHFAYWCRKPEEEMQNFLSTVPNDPDALPPVLDVEATPTSGTCHKTLYHDETIAQMRRMLEIMERAYGKRPVIYTTVDFYQSILSPNELTEYPIWIRSTKYSPHVRYGSRKWHLWQFQSDARIPGIRGNVDRNAFHGDARQFQAFASGLKEPAALGYAPDEAVATQDAPAERTLQTSAAADAIPGAVARPQPMDFVPAANIGRPPARVVVTPIDPDE